MAGDGEVGGIVGGCKGVLCILEIIDGKSRRNLMQIGPSML